MNNEWQYVDKDGNLYLSEKGSDVCTGCAFRLPSGSTDEDGCDGSQSVASCITEDIIWIKAADQPEVFAPGNHIYQIPGTKYDGDKLKYSLIPPYALQAAAKNLTEGLKKYPERDNWKKVDNAQERYLDAMMRHLEAHRRGEIYDTESSDPTMLHMAAVLVNAMFLLEFMLDPNLKGE